MGFEISHLALPCSHVILGELTTRRGKNDWKICIWERDNNNSSSNNNNNNNNNNTYLIKNPS